VCPGLAHRTVRCTREDRPQTLQLRVSPAQLRYNSPDCPVYHRTVRCASVVTVICAQRSTLTVNSAAQWTRQKSEQLVRGAPDYPVSHLTVRCHMRTKPPTVDQLQALTAGWRGGVPDTVRWRTRLSDAPIANSLLQRLHFGWCL
jgi:hypothetical protein